MKKPILQNLVEMTGLRDHLRLEVSVLSTLQTLAGITDIRALELFTHQGQTFIRPRTWMEGGQLVSSEVDASHDPRSEPLAHYPQLQQCIDERQPSVQYTPRRGRHILCLPVWMGDNVSTCLEVTQSRTFAAHRREVVLGIFQVYQNYQGLLDYSERDALTGLFNRKTFDEQFARFAAPQVRLRPAIRLPKKSSPAEGQSQAPDATDTADTTDAVDAADTTVLHGCATVQKPLVQHQQQWLGVIDIDHFKQVNDRFGHLYGDEVLILMANLLRSSFRSQDRVFRFGGEEFVVLLRHASLDTAQRIFNRFREAVQAHKFPQVGHVTVSIGFVSTAKGSPVEILGQADQALYYAKEHGRNQVRYYEDLVSTGQLQIHAVQADVELF